MKRVHSDAVSESNGQELAKKAKLNPAEHTTESKETKETKEIELSTEYDDLEKLLPEDWALALVEELKQPYFQKIKTFLNRVHGKGAIIFPPKIDIFAAFCQCAVDKASVIIIGQYPYIRPSQAMGMAFAVSKQVDIPPSLNNMYTELESDIAGFKRPSHGDLSCWAEQGVFLLNAILTVMLGRSNSHEDCGWQEFTSAVIDYLCRTRTHLVFMLWGTFAKRKGSSIDRSKHLVLEAPHPSPYSADSGFFGCKHFSKANAYLTEHALSAIDWNIV